MRVIDLIQALQNMPLEAEVMIYDEHIRTDPQQGWAHPCDGVDHRLVNEHHTVEGFFQIYPPARMRHQDLKKTPVDAVILCRSTHRSPK